MYSDFAKILEEVKNYTYTENGAIALSSTGNKVLDAFGSLGAMKDSNVNDILNTFYDAFNEDRVLAMKLLFYIRDIRGGQGMRRIFRVILSSLADTYPKYVINNLDNILFAKDSFFNSFLIFLIPASSFLDFKPSFSILANKFLFDISTYCLST